MLAAACARANKDPLAQPDGEWLFINYWAEWCKPCIEEIPQLNAFHRGQAGKARVVMVNFDGASGAALQEQADCHSQAAASQGSQGDPFSAGVENATHARGSSVSSELALSPDSDSV